MNFITSYDICHTFDEKPTRENIEKYIKLVGGNIDSDNFDNFMTAIKDKSYDEILNIGSSMVVLQNSVKTTDIDKKEDNNKVEATTQVDNYEEESDVDFDFGFD